jgi:hypothetical protein
LDRRPVVAKDQLRLSSTPSKTRYYVEALASSSAEKDSVASHKLGVNAIKELRVFWAIINQPPPGSIRKNLLENGIPEDGNGY